MDIINMNEKELNDCIENNLHILEGCSEVTKSNPAKAQIEFALFKLNKSTIENLQRSIERNSKITSSQNRIMIILTIVIIILTLISFFSTNGYGQEKSFIREYFYKASETDSKVSSRQKALQEVKVLLIEELGTYVESYVNYQVTEENNRITKDFFTNEIKTLSAGTTELTILEESWDGYEYYVKSEIKADPNEIITRINQTLSIREKNLAIDSLKILLTSSNSQIQIKDAELVELQKKIVSQNLLVVNKESEVKTLEKQLAEAKTNLNKYETQKQLVLTEIQKIEIAISNSTTKAIDNVRIGMTPTEVIKVCGNPRSTDDCSELNYNYGSVWVMFEGGIVKAVVDARDFERCGNISYHKTVVKARFIKQ